MLILSLDSAGMGCSACVLLDGEVRAEAAERMERGQDQRLMPMLLDVMKRAGVRFPDLDRVAVTRGPGSFTGIRIGLAAARGIGLASQKPVVGIDRFRIFHYLAAEPGKNLLVVINSRRRELFVRFFPALGTPAEADVMTPEEMRAFLFNNPNTIVTGDLALTGLLSFKTIEANEAATAALLAMTADPGDPEYLPRPLYLRPPDVTFKKPVLRLEPAGLKELERLASIHAAAFLGDAWTGEQIAGSLTLDTSKAFLAVEGDKAKGFILLQLMKDRTEILTIAVDPIFQRQGIGEKLMSVAIDAGKRIGTDFIALEVAADNHAARRLYEKAGFRVAGTRRNYYVRGDRTIDAILYEKPLNDDRA